MSGVKNLRTLCHRTTKIIIVRWIIEKENSIPNYENVLLSFEKFKNLEHTINKKDLYPLCIFNKHLLSALDVSSTMVNTMLSSYPQRVCIYHGVQAVK